MYQLGPFALDPQQQLLVRDGARIHLARKPYQILLHLIEHRDRLVSRRELLDRFWDGKDVYDQTLTKAVGRIRKALGESNDEPVFIETRWATGYRYIGPFELLSGNGSAGPIGAPATATPAAPLVTTLQISTSAIPLPSPTHNLPHFSARRIAAVSLLLVAALLAAAWSVHRPTSSIASSLAKTPRPSIAVLGFTDLSKQPDSAWLSTAISEMLTTEIDSAHTFRAVPGESIARARAELNLALLNGLSPESLAHVRQTLGADMVVTGAFTVIPSTANAPSQVRLDLRIQDTRTGETISSSSNSAPLSDLFSLVGVAASDLRRSAGIPAASLRSSQALASAPSNPEAARLYAEGLNRLRAFDAPAARDLLEKSVSAEPSFPLSHAALAQAWSILGHNTSAIDEAKTAFDLSFNLGPDERLLIEGAYRRAASHWDASASIYSDLFRRYPDDVDYGLRLAEVQRLGGHGREALVTLSSLKTLPLPLSGDPRILLEEARTQTLLSDYSRGRVAVNAATREARHQGAQYLLAQALVTSGDVSFASGAFAQARESAEEARQICQRIGDPSCLADAYLALGRSEIFASPADALQNRREAYQVASQHGLDGLAATALTDMANNLFYAGQLAEAAQDYNQAAAIFTKIDDRVGLLRTSINRGNICFREGNLHEARMLYTQAVALSESAGQRNFLFLSLSNLGSVEELEGDLASAMRDQQKALQAAHDMGTDPGWALANIGDLLYTEGDFAAARSTLEQVLPPKRTGVIGYFGQAEADMAEMKFDEGDAAAAESLARQDAARAVENKDADNEARAYEILARTLLVQGKSADALQAIRHADSLLQPPFQDDAALDIAITSARVTAAQSQYSPDAVRKALDRLRQISDISTKHGNVSVRFNVRLAKAQLELDSRRYGAAKADLKALSQEAHQTNFGLIEHRAQTLLASAASNR